MRRRLNVGRGYPPRLAGFVLTTIFVGMPLAAGAAIAFAVDLPTLREMAGVGVFFALTLIAELRPVPADLEGKHLVSLAFVFLVATQLLYSWEASVLVGAAAIAAAQLPGHKSMLKLVFNTAVYAIAAAAAAVPALLVGYHGHDAGYFELMGLVAAAGAVFAATNVVMVCIAVGLATARSVKEMLEDHLRHSAPAISIMIFLAAQAVIFWHLSPFLLALVGAPLFTLNLYQRTSLKGRAALKAAATDSLTGLKNHRAYQEDIDAALAGAFESESSHTLCLIDIDRFKQVNDRHGHPVGDAVLRLLSDLIGELVPRQGYRLGGDEFAVLLDGETEGAETVMADLQARFRDGQTDAVPERVTVSCGIASFPLHATEAGELKKCADLALYQSKHNGKDCVSVYSEDFALGGVMMASTEEALKDVRLQTAEKLVAVVDARDAYVGRHSFGVARLVEAIGRVLGLEQDELARLRLAGLLHDLGKIAVPDHILNKPAALDPAELELMRKHSQTGYELLDGLDLAPVDTWILHHHEHWDGSGYPHGLAGEDIPFGSRIILVADAFEAMTTHRSYRRAISVDAAMTELRDKAGIQFDPVVVAALNTYLGSSRAMRDSVAPDAAPAWSI